MDDAQARRRKALERLNAYDSGPSEDERRAAKEFERCMELLAEANRPTCSRTLGVFRFR